MSQNVAVYPPRVCLGFPCPREEAPLSWLMRLTPVNFVSVCVAEDSPAVRSVYGSSDVSSGFSTHAVCASTDIQLTHIPFITHAVKISHSVDLLWA